MERNAFFKWITSHRSSRFIQIQEQGKDESRFLFQHYFH